MKHLLIITIMMGMFFSCQDDIGIEKNIPENDDKDKIPVKLSLSLGTLLENATEYVTMRSTAATTANDVKAYIPTDCYVLIAKKFGNDWIVDDLFYHQLISGYGYADVKDDTPLKDIDLLLRPGDYRMTVITASQFAVKWNPDVKIGTRIEESNLPWFCTYITGSGGGYPEIEGKKYLGCEIFSGKKDFEIQKTTELDGTALPQDFVMTLNRAVSQFRILLKDTTIAGNTWIPAAHQVVRAVLRAPSGNAFCSGLNVWGEGCYNEEIREMTYAAWSKTDLETGVDGSQYYVSGTRTRVHAVNYFSAPGKDLVVTVDNVNVSAISGAPEYISTSSAPGTPLVHNKITGVIFGPAATIDSQNRELELIPGDAGLLLPPYTECN